MFLPCLQSCDISSTVDPSYVISLIRQLLPREDRLNVVEDHNGTKEKITAEALDDLVLHSDLSKGSTDKGFSVNLEDLSALNGDNGTCKESKQLERNALNDDEEPKGSETKDPWEGCGCILWDLSASKIHAELMVLKFSVFLSLAPFQLHMLEFIIHYFSIDQYFYFNDLG